MGKTISVASFQEMGKAANQLKEISELYTEIYTQLLQEANTMGAAWEGADNLAFVEQINGFTDDLKQMADKIMLAGLALEQQKKNYVDRQESNIVNAHKLTN